MSVESVLIVTPIELEQINKLYGRTKEDIAKDVELIQDWLRKQPHFPQNEDVYIIERGLKFNKFSVERVKQKSDYFYAVKSCAPEYMQNIHPLHPSMQKVSSYSCFVPMPKLCPDFGRIVVSKLLFENCPDFSGIDSLKGILMHTEYRVSFDSQMHDTVIYDMINHSFANMMAMHPTDVTKCYNIITKAYSAKIKGIHFINTPTYAMGFIKLLKRLLSDKMGKRIHVHANLESLCEHVPKENLPKDYGGNELPLIELHQNWVKFMESKNDWMLERAEMKSNEKLRIGTPLDIEVFGTAGTFRKINID